MWRPIAEFIDDYRIWHKITFQRGRILRTRSGAWQDLDRPELYADPRSFYAADGRVPEVTVTHEREDRLAHVERFTFPSGHRIEGWPARESDTAAGRIYRNRIVPEAPVVVLSHGWAHDGWRALEVIYVEPLLREGFSVALLALPFHFERAPPGTYSGELMVSGDVLLTVEAFRQGVADLIGLTKWLRDRGGRGVGLVGYSLGGYLAGIVACLHDDLDYVVIGAAGHSVISPILDTDLGTNVREDLSWSGMHRRENLERAWGIISPGKLRPRIPRQRLLLVAGLYDRIMLRSSVQELWMSWGRPPIRWEDQGHYSLLAVPGRLVRRSLPFMRPLADRAGGR